MTSDAMTEAAQFTVTAEAIRRYARLTHDDNPIHLDADFARTTPMGGIIAHGTMSAALIWQALRLNASTPCDQPAAFVGARLSIRFRQPVRIDDTVHGEVVPDDGAPGRCTVRVVRQDGACVIEGSLTLSGHATARASGPNNL